MTTSGEIISTYSSYMFGTICVIIIPLVMVCLNLRPVSKIQNPVFKSKFGPLLSELNLRSRLSLNYFSTYYLRRLIYTASSFYIQSFTCRILILMYNNLMAMIMIGTNPFSERMLGRF